MSKYHLTRLVWQTRLSAHFFICDLDNMGNIHTVGPNEALVVSGECVFILPFLSQECLHHVLLLDLYLTRGKKQTKDHVSREMVHANKVLTQFVFI